MSISYLQPIKCRITVEQPGIGVFYNHDLAICQYCGEANQFSDPSDFDNEKGVFVWAMKQYAGE